ncbi:uncharacterized protein LOC125220050 [Salvia hispanica]|uniref:uncharacterized protein LOC125220050 n=1 Tax=Salvia hispanica TaxID=49212 RepID=UPI002009D063|nr:uncharacterized protein LOC125220050 [Salvia hispanica]XP_047978124.1 uncharacterized protein LOC125220050 [Salvia hispanica]
MEMPREIMHPIHPSHPLTLHLGNILGSRKCAFCEGDMLGLSYRCSHGGCNGLVIHLRCAAGLKDNNETQLFMDHPSHPQHQLRFSKKTRWCPFPCDACGATEKGDSYTCTLCDYSIHQRCALLPESKNFPLHHHSLSLAFYPPREYVQDEFFCAICNTTLQLRRWVYHCHLCSYIVHINCATNSSSMFGDENENATEDEKEVTKFPVAVDDMYEEMIRPFVKRESGQLSIPYGDHDNQNIGGKYRFFGHTHHLLTFTTFSSASSSSPSSSHHYCKIDDEEDHDEDDFESITRSEKICDGCTLAIHEKKQTDDDGYESGYMSCDECKYFLHLSCFNLPLEIPSLPVHSLKDHNLRLQNGSKLAGWTVCGICYARTNGLHYACTSCNFNIDINCASLPITVKHAAHPRHNYLKLVMKDDTGSNGFCVSCYMSTSVIGKRHYKCNSCRFCVCVTCLKLPTTNKHRMEKHLLSLTYDAYVNRPGDFYCSSCENHMNRRRWMYYCRDCDQSFHPKCFPATSGWYRNIKFGTEQYVISSIHDHPLIFQIITNKMACDLCHYYYYDEPGFQCASCFFVVCKSCGIKNMDDAQKSI